LISQVEFVVEKLGSLDGSKDGMGELELEAEGLRGSWVDRRKHRDVQLERAHAERNWLAV